LAGRLLHSLKGTSGNLGAMQLYAATNKLELSLKQQQPYQEALRNFIASFDEVMQGLEELPNQGVFTVVQPLPSGPVDFATIRPLLQELSQYLQEASPQAVDLLPNIKYAAKGNLHELFANLTEHVYTFQFEKAVTILGQIKQKLRQMENAVGG